ncbi:DNA internalization-related competence protein ComEC/Rec2 [Paenibacillus septentrionalis]|uniref:DNA internalization-related competence protein ComEC/Rec2 n=1 Tax=Paenibacillus septentrionalis TaxID=429342 RepID=A0ABW1V4C4_9BACL
MIQKRPIIYLVIAFLLGHLAASMQKIDIWLLVLLALLMLLACTLLLKHCTASMLGLLLLLFIAGSAERYIVDQRNVTALPENWEGGSVQATGMIVSNVDIDGNSVKFTFQSSETVLHELDYTIYEKEVFMVHVTLQAEEELEQARLWTRGSAIQLAGDLSIPAEASNEGAFDYQLYLKRQGIHWLWKSSGSSNVEVIETSWHPIRLLHGVDVLREHLSAPFDRMFSPEESGFLKGLTLGIRSDLDPEQFRSFSTVGLTHILAISGLHVAVFMYMMTALLKMLRLSKERIISFLLLAIPCYIALTGASPSVLRAGMMAMIGLLAARAGRLKDGLHIISAVAGILILWDPYMIHNVSFQLSFIVTLGIMIGVPAFQSVLPSAKKWKWATDLLSITVVAQIISFPVTIYYFNQFHFLSLVANFFLVPFISMIIMPLALFVLFLGHVSIVIAKPISSIVHWCNELTFVIVKLLGEIEKLHTIWATPPIVWIMLWYATWIFIFYLWRTRGLLSRNSAQAVSTEETEPIGVIDDMIHLPQSTSWIKKHYRGVISFSVVLSLLLYAYMPQALDRTASVSFLDIGQGDASLIRTPTGKIILIDGGGTISFGEQEAWKQRRDPFEVGKKVLLPLLMKRGVHHIDLLVISHLDSDHIGGLYEVVNTIPIKEMWWNGSYNATDDAQKLFALVMEKNISLRTPLIGESIEIDRYTTIDMLWPLKQSPLQLQEVKKQNEQSIVFLLTIYQSTFLYTGDIGKETEEQIIDEFSERLKQGLVEPLPRIAVMKAAHHGSRYSTDYSWMSYMQPQTTVISAGRNNHYGHPHPDVLGRLAQYQSHVLRTDLQGEINFQVESNDLYYRKWK